MASLSRQNGELTTANQELKVNYEESCRKVRQLQQEAAGLREKAGQVRR